MRSGLDRMWLILPVLGCAVMGSAVFACSGGVHAGAPSRARVDPPAPARATSAQREQVADAPATSTTSSPQPPAQMVLTPGSARTVTWAPLMGRRGTSLVAETSVSSFNVPLQCGQAVPCPTAASPVTGWIQLDEHAPRPFLLGRPLISLLNEDEEVAPGEHMLLAVLLTPEQVHADAASFRVEHTRRAQPPSRPAQAPGSIQAPEESLDPFACFLLLPETTVNGHGDRALELLAVLVGVRGLDQLSPPHPQQPEHQAVIHYVATSEAGVARGSFPEGTSALLERPAAGDVRIEVSCDRDGKEVARSERTVTINPELIGAKK